MAHPQVKPQSPHKQSLTLGRVKEFSFVARALAPLTPPMASLRMVNTLLALYPPNIDSSCLDSLLNFQPYSNFELSMNFFRLTFLHMFHLLAHGPFGMVFEHLWDSFDLGDSRSGFIQLHHLCFHVASSHILWSMAWVSGVNRLLILAKLSGGIRLIIMGEVFYHLVSKVSCLQFRDVFIFHLSPYQFKVAVKSGCEVMFHGIWATLDGHHDWAVLQIHIVNAFNIISHETFF